jgi:hypothetical protein
LIDNQWDRDPGVLFMRDVFASMEKRQAELLEKANIRSSNPGLRSTRKMALHLFEESWSVAAGSGRSVTKEIAVDLYLHCLVRALRAKGFGSFENLLARNTVIEGLLEGLKNDASPTLWPLPDLS